MSFKELTLVGAMALALVGCGGGGGGGGEPPPNNGGGLPPVGTFSGSTADAVLTPENVGYYLTFLFDGPATLASDDGVLAAPQEPSLLPAPKSLLGLAGFGDNPGPQSRATVSETMTCQRGSVAVSGTLNDNDGTGTLTLQLNKCFDGAVEMTGRAVIAVSEYDFDAQTPVKYTIGYDGVTVKDSAGTLTSVQGIQEVVVTGSYDESITSNLVGVSESDTHNFYARNLRQTNSAILDSNGVQYTESYEGELFVGQLGRISVATPRRLTWFDLPLPGNASKVYQVCNGSLTLESSRSSFSAEWNTCGGLFDDDRESLAHVRLDQDRDGALELDRELGSYFVSVPPYIDFADDDNDGMWNGWERLHALSVEHDDSLDDADGDGYNNYIELLAGTSPLSQSQHPDINATLAVADPDGLALPPRHELLGYEGQAIDFPLVMTGALDPALAGPGTVVAVSVYLANQYGSYGTNRPGFEMGGEWTITSDYGCSIVSDLNGDTRRRKVAHCTHVPISQLAEQSQTDVFATLSLSGAAAASADLLLAVDVSAFYQPINRVAFELDMARGAWSLSSYDRAYDLELLSETFSRYIPLELRGFGVPDKFSLEVELESDNDLTLRSISSSPLFPCQLKTARSFSCRSESRHWEIYLGMVFNRPASYGKATLKAKLVSEHGEVITSVTQEELNLAFGSSLADALEQGRHGADDDKISLPEGIYVGTARFDEHVDIEGHSNTEIWLMHGGEADIERFGSDASYSDGGGLHCNAGCSLSKLNLYVYPFTHQLIMNRNGIALHGGRISDSNITVIHGHYPVLFLLGGDVDMVNTRIVTSAKGIKYRQEMTVFKCYGCNFRAENLLFVDVTPLNVRLFEGIPGTSHREVLNSSLLGVDEFFVETDRSEPVTKVTLANSIVTGLRTPVMPDGVVLQSLYLSDFSANNILPALWANDGGNNIYTDTPMLDPDTFAPLPGSPAIDAGADLSAEFTTDLLGNPRPVGAGFDIGAIEVQAP